MIKPPNNTLYGYTRKEIDAIVKARKIDKRKFNKAFGCNTCITINNTTYYYKCDVERALYKLGHKDGRYHEED